ncbi:hypothetical protein BKA81DRAFT_356788 [Phyllosticta paracitricarpa]|uniref:F-box domain-containing protein n=1 Tax=Phyllosticta paracitricarpa TaxID=2016321 RepID=A0ABR1NCD1_9PEZI
MTTNVFDAPTARTRQTIYDDTDSRLERQCPLDNGRHVCNDYAEHIDFGDFEKLPLEIVQIILAKLDLRTLTDIRRVNKRAMQIVDWVPEYKTIFKQAPNILRTILSVETGSFITCESLHRKLSQENCRKCDRVAAYFHILACKRLCTRCLNRKRLPFLVSREDYYPTPMSETEFANLQCRTEKFPYMLTLPERASNPKRLILVKLPEQSIAYSKLHGWTFYDKDESKANESNRSSQVRPVVSDKKLRESLWMAQLKYCDEAVIRAPIIKPGAASAEWTFECDGCATLQFDSRPLGSCPNDEYTEETYSDHIKEHGDLVLDGHRYFHAKYLRKRR